jgi:protein SCO1
MKTIYVVLGLLFLLAVAGCARTDAQAEVSPTTNLRGAVIEPPRPIGDFTLPSTTGEDFTFSQQRGKVMLIYFGYMTCPDVCPSTFADLRRVYTELGEDAEKVSVVFITVDPERDTLDRLSVYMAAFHEDFIALRPDAKYLQSILSDFGAQASRREVEGSALGYMMDHTASVFLVTSDGNLQEQFLFGTAYQDIVHDMRELLHIRRE